MKFNRFFALFSLFLVLSAHPMLYAQESSQNEDVSFSQWKVAVLGIQADDFYNLAPHLRQTAFAISSLLEEIVSQTPTRILSPRERIAARESIRERALRTRQKELDDAIVKEDTAALEKKPHMRWKEYIKAKKTIKDLRKKVSSIKSIENEKIPLSRSLPVVHAAQTAYLFFPVGSDIAATTADLNVHQVLFFTLSMLDEEYIAISIHTYNIVHKKIDLVLQTAIARNETKLLSKSLSFAVSQSILGTPVASLRILARTSAKDEFMQRRIRDASIFVDGSLVGHGSVFIPFLRAGAHSIAVVLGKERRTLNISLSKGERASRTVFFNTPAEETVTLVSVPSQAEIYLNSEWVGTSPLVLPKPSSATVEQIELRAEGHSNAKLSLSRLTPSAVTITLDPTHEIPLEKRLKRDRARFYTGFALFGFSLFIPIVLNGIHTSETAALNAIKADPNPRVSPARFAEAETRGTALFYSYIGTAILSGGVGIYAFVTLFQYLRTASEYHKR